MLSCRSLRRGLLAGLATALIAMPLVAQDRAERTGVLIEGAGGLAVPAGSFGDYVVSGPSTALRLAYWLSPRVALEFGGAVDLFDGKAVTADRTLPDVTLWRYTVGLAADVLPSHERLSLVGNLGLGVTTFDTDFFEVGRIAEADLYEQYFTAEGGLRVGYDLFSNVGAFLEGRAYWMRPDRQDFVMLAAFDPENLTTIDQAWVVPVRAGIQIDF